MREEARYGVLNAALRVGSARGEHQRQYVYVCTTKASTFARLKHLRVGGAGGEHEGCLRVRCSIHTEMPAAELPQH